MPHIRNWGKNKLRRAYNKQKKRASKYKKKSRKERKRADEEEKKRNVAVTSLALSEAKIIRIRDYVVGIGLVYPGEPFDPNDPDDPNIPDDPDDPNRPIGRDCIDFEDLIAGDEYPHSAGPASSFVSEGARFEVVAESAVMLPADPAVSGKVVVEASPGAGMRNCPFDFGQSMNINNAVLKLDVTQFPDWVDGAYTACFKYCDLGGHTYLRINGKAWDFVGAAEAAPGTNSPELSAYDGLTLGGVDVRVTKFLYPATSSSGVPVGDHFGMVFLSSNTERILTIEVGGQEFWTDYWCIPCDEHPGGGPPDNPPPTVDPPGTVVPGGTSSSSQNAFVSDP